MSNSLVPPLFPEQPDFQYIWKQSESYEPKKEKKIQSLSAAMDVDEDTVRQNLPDYEALFASQQLYNDTVARSYPIFYRNLSNTPFVAAARDDMGNLIETEGWWNEIANAYNVARDTVAIGNIGTRAMLDGRDLYPYERRKIERARQRQRAHMQSEPGFLAAAAELAGTMQETLGYSLAAGYTAGAVSGPAAPVVGPIAAGIAGFATSFNLEAGNLYADLIMDGYTPAQATEIGASYGALIAGFEAVGLKFAGKPIKELGKELFKKQGRDLLRRETAGQITGRIFADYAKGILAESTTEGVQEILSELGKARASQIYRPENLYEPEYYETFQQAFVHTAKGMVVLGGVPSAVRLANDSIKSANANYDFEKAREAAEIRSRSQAPEAQSQIDAEAAEADSYNSSYYIRAQDFLTGIRAQGEAQGFTEQQVRETVEANSPGLMSRIDEAAERDGDVELTKADWDKAFHDTKFRETTFLHTAFEEDGLTKREADENEAIREKAMQDASEEAKQALQDQETFEQELREVRRDLRNQLDVALEGMDAAQTMTAAANAAVLSGFIRRNALAMGIGPKEFVEKHLPQIVQQRLGAGPVGPQALAAFAGEASNMTPEVQQLFRQAVQLSEEGKNAREIWEATGWYVGPDGKPYYEINDQNARVSLALANAPTGTSSNLRRVLNHPELFEAYPELESLKVEYVYGDVNRQGKAAGRLGTLTLSQDGSMQISLNENLRQDPDLLKSVLLHEVQHAIQVMERSKIQGGVSEKVTRTDLDAMLDRDLTAIESSLSDSARAVEQDGKSIADMFRIIARSLVYRSVPITERKKITASLREIANNLSEADKTHVLESLDIMNDFYRVGAPDSKYRSLQDMVYQRLAGEAEARNAEARLSMTAEERRQSFPQDTADIPTSRLILAVGKSDESGAVGLLKPDIGADPVSESTAFLEGVTRPERFGLPPRETAPRPDTLESGTFDQDADYTFTEGDYRPEVVAWAKEQFGDRVAPNGKPVYQNFLEFFGDSMVLDEEGRPLVMYHGTKAPGFKEFEYRYLMHGLFGVGIYTTENSKVAGGYAGVDPDAKRPKNDKGGGIFPLLVSIKNPIDMDAEPDLDKWRAAFPDVEFPDGIEKNEYAYRHVEAFFGIRSEAVGWKTRGAAKTFLARSEKRQAPSARDINEGKSSSPDILRLATEIRELQKKGNRIHRRRKDAARSLLKKMGFDPFATFLSQGLPKKYSDKVEVVSSELLQYSFQRSPSDNPNIPGHLNTYKVEYVDSYFGKQTVVVGAIDSRNTTIRFAVERDLSQRMLGAFGASIDRKQADNPYSLANGSYPFKGMRLEGKALNEVTDAMREAQEDQFELEDISESLAEKENELEALRLTDDGQDITELVQNGLVRMGHDGITHLGGGRVADERHRVYIAFEPNQIKSFYNKGDFSPLTGELLFSKEGDKKVLGTASFEGTDAIQKILLDPDAKPTTLMHELMHWNLELMATIGLDIEGKLAQEGYEATALERQMLDDIQRLLKWSGFEGTLTEWRAMTTDQRRPFHEAVAVSFETYLYEGVAPSRELRGVFRRLLSYIAGKFEELVKGFQKDYEQEFGRPLPGLTDEVRAIFGRMMSAERDVQAFFDESELDAMMMTKKEWTDSGRDADEYDEYEREFKDALTEATAELTIQRMKEVKTFANAYALVAQKQRGELQRISKEIRQEVQAQVEVESVYQFVSWMRKGTYQSENGTVEPVNLPSAEGTKTSRKLNAAIVKAVAPDLYSQLARRGLTSKNGVTLEKVRGMFGFESNRAMLEALATHRNIKEEVLHRTNQRLLNEHTSLMDPIVQQENIHAAVHNKIRQRVVARELKFLLQNGRRSKQELELAKRIAEALIEKTPVGNIDIVAYKRAAARARKKAFKALKDGDMEAAAFAKRQELVNEQMIVEGLKARKEVRSLIESNKRAFKHRTDKALASAGYDVTVMKALRAVLARLGIGNVDFDANEALARFVKEDPEFAAEVSGNIASLLGKDIAQPRVGDRRKPMEHLTLGDIRVLRLLSARMMLRAKNKLKTKIGEKRQRVEAAQDEAASTLESNVKDGTKDLDGKKSIFGKIRNYFSDLIRFEHLFRRADGGKVGIWTQMFRMVKDAGNRYRQEFKEFAEDFGNRLRALDLTIPGGARELELTVYGNRVVIGENGRNVKSQLIHLAMHYYGNASNRQRLLRGYIGQDIDPELLDEAMEQADLEVKTFLQEQIRQGLLTRKDFEFMQETFKQLSGANMLGRAQQVMMRLRHYEMDTIEGEKFSVQFPDGETVEFMGGYIPIRYDTSTASVRESDAPGLQDEDMSIEQQATRMLGILPSFTKDRTGPAALPLELNLANIQHHAAEVFKFIHMAEPVTEVYKVVSGRKVRQTFIRKFGTKAYRNMEGWLRRSAYQKFDKSDDTQVGDLMLTMARNANMGIMFLNIGNALQNYAGLIIPMRRVGARRIISALMSNMFSNGPRAEVAEKSVEMRIRLERQIFDIYNQQQKLLTQEGGVWDRIQDWSNRYAYFLQQWTQNHVDVAVWQAAYNQETEVALREMIGQPDAEAKAEARAVAYADSIVRQTQMAGEKEDLSNFESQGSIYRAMFPFKSWFINWMNNASNQRRLDMDKKGQAKAAALASSYMYLLMLPAMMATAAVEIARGEDFDDDDDGYGDDMWELWWRSQAEQITGGLPVIQEATRVMDTFWFDDEYWNNRYPATPWQRVIENIAKAPLKDDTVDAAGSLVSQIADLMGIPASRVWKSVNLLGDEFIRDDLESESTYDFIRGAVTGQRSDLQRLSQ